jgi:hypothetical protein
MECSGGGYYMKTLKQELRDLETKAAEQREALVAKHSLLSHLGDLVGGYHPPFIHHTKLYGASGWISFSGSEYSSIREGKNPDRELFRKLLEKFPPCVPLIKVWDGCVSFRPDIPKNNEKGDIYDCGPIVVKVEVFQSHRATFKWYATINEGMYEISITFPLHWCNLGQLNARPRYVGGILTSWERCDFHANAPAQVIKWASGGKQYPNSFTLYWDRDSGNTLDFPGMVKE